MRNQRRDIGIFRLIIKKLIFFVNETKCERLIKQRTLREEAEKGLRWSLLSERGAGERRGPWPMPSWERTSDRSIERGEKSSRLCSLQQNFLERGEREVCGFLSVRHLGFWRLHPFPQSLRLRIQSDRNLTKGPLGPFNLCSPYTAHHFKRIIFSKRSTYLYIFQIQSNFLISNSDLVVVTRFSWIDPKCRGCLLVWWL